MFKNVITVFLSSDNWHIGQEQNRFCTRDYTTNKSYNNLRELRTESKEYKNENDSTSNA